MTRSLDLATMISIPEELLEQFNRGNVFVICSICSIVADTRSTALAYLDWTALFSALACSQSG